MELTLTIAALALAVLAVLVVLLRGTGRGDDAGLAGELAAARAVGHEAQRQINDLQSALVERQEQLALAREAVAALERDKLWLGEELGRHKQALGSTQELVDRADQRLREAFSSLAADALRNNRGAFMDLAKLSFEGLQKEALQQMDSRHRSIDALVQPMAETLKQVDTRLSAAERERLEAYTRLAEQVTQLGSATQTLSQALRTPAVRGRWGEMQLRRVVEMAGMLRHCDFDEQPGLESDNGRLRPDLIVHLPGGKQIVVDAKAPLEAFLDAQECNEEGARAVKLQAHARQVRQHVEKLGSKAYWEQLGASPEMVVMFLPGEMLFSAALQHDLTLLQDGVQRRVLLTSPITLIALLTTIAHAWRQEALTDNYRAVAQLGKELYDRVAKFTEHFDEVRKRLDGAVQAYNQAAGSFESRVLVSARRLKELGATTADEIPSTDPIDTVPRVLKQAGLMGLPEGAMGGEEV